MKLVNAKLALALLLTAPAAYAGNIGDGLGIGNFNTIIGGTDVKQGDAAATSTVLVVGKSDDGTFICSGTIIDKDIVLTAAHCLGTDGLAQIVVVFRTSIQGTGPISKVTDRRQYSDFLDRAQAGDKDWHDLALVKLASPLPAGYAPAKFLPSADLLKVGTTVTLAGYGINVPLSTPDSKDDDGAGVLRRVDQSVIDNKYGDTEFLVSLANNKGACHGDSGGPAYVNQNGTLYIIGVASRMTEKDRVANNGDVNDFSCSVEMVYTSVLAQNAWITANMKQLHGGK
ncbi:MAG: S1 family peptidase [Bdellovibrionota bacterium]